MRRRATREKCTSCYFLSPCARQQIKMNAFFFLVCKQALFLIIPVCFLSLRPPSFILRRRQNNLCALAKFLSLGEEKLKKAFLHSDQVLSNTQTTLFIHSCTRSCIGSENLRPALKLNTFLPISAPKHKCSIRACGKTDILCHAKTFRI